jgi:dUTP pyrophosphatase
MSKIRGFEIVSKYKDDFVYTQEEYEAHIDELNKDDKPASVKRLFIKPHRATKKSACYDVYNQTGEDIVLAPNEMSGAITTYIKSYMLDDEVLKAFVRSGHGFKFSVRLANSTGIIDADYYNNPNNEGEIFLKLHNQGEKELVIKDGQAMGQLMFQKYLIADDDETTVGGDRQGGIGSTTKS